MLRNHVRLRSVASQPTTTLTASNLTLHRHATPADERKSNAMGNGQSARHVLSSSFRAALRMSGNILVAQVSESNLVLSATWCLGCGTNSSLYRAYVGELEQRLRQMEDRLQQLSRGEKVPQQAIHASRPPGVAAGPGEEGEEEEVNVLLRAQFPDGEAVQTGQNTSDQPSYFLRGQNGRMRFYGRFSLSSLGARKLIR